MRTFTIAAVRSGPISRPSERSESMEIISAISHVISWGRRVTTDAYPPVQFWRPPREAPVLLPVGGGVLYKAARGPRSSQYHCDPGYERTLLHPQVSASAAMSTEASDPQFAGKDRSRETGSGKRNCADQVCWSSTVPRVKFGKWSDTKKFASSKNLSFIVVNDDPKYVRETVFIYNWQYAPVFVKT